MNKIRDVRSRCGMTLKQVSEATANAINGQISIAKLSKMELGQCRLWWDDLETLASVFNCKAGELVGESADAE